MSNPDLVRVDLGDRSYDILIGPDVLAGAGDRIAPFTANGRVFIVTDETVAGLHLKPLRATLEASGLSAETVVLPAGESTKNFDNLQLVIEHFLDKGAERSDVVIALGGGVIGDLTGLAAGLLKRGTNFVQIPTTLLSQVDSSVGGKTAINTRQGKNLLGMFYQPRLVLADLSVLATLPRRELLAGYAEVLKYALIDDPDFFAFLETHADAILALDPEPLTRAVRTSCEAKARIVAADETERGQRALLNLGHTFGHALERANGYGPELLHGEAVATGMALAARYSARAGLMAENDVIAIERHLSRVGLVPSLTDLPGGPYPPHDLARHMTQDKKMESGKLTLILMRGIGRAFLSRDADLSDVERFLNEHTKAGVESTA